MPYCLACGNLRDTIDGLCDQCRKDEYLLRSRKLICNNRSKAKGKLARQTGNKSNSKGIYQV